MHQLRVAALETVAVTIVHSWRICDMMPTSSRWMRSRMAVMRSRLAVMDAFPDGL